MYTKKCGLVFAASLLGIVACSTAWAADFVNGGFESTPAFTGWTVSGSAQIVDATFGKVPPQGLQQAYLDNDETNGALDVTALESALSLNQGTLSGGSYQVINGSAISQTITVADGAGVNFTWDFLTSEDPNFSPSNDFSFAILRNTATDATSISVLGDFTTAVIGLPYNGSLPSPSTDDFLSETGYENTTLEFAGAGTYEVSFGVANRVNNSIASALLVDNVAIVPESGYALWFAPLAGAALFLGIRRRGARQAA